MVYAFLSSSMVFVDIADKFLKWEMLFVSISYEFECTFLPFSVGAASVPSVLNPTEKGEEQSKAQNFIWNG